MSPENSVLKLNKAIHGFKQSPQLWNDIWTNIYKSLYINQQLTLAFIRPERYAAMFFTPERREYLCTSSRCLLYEIERMKPNNNPLYPKEYIDS